MRGIVLENKKLVMKDFAEPQIHTPGQVKVKILGSGICGSDINIVRGNIPAVENMILGHEAIGTVIEVGEKVKTLKVGDRVIIDPTQSCGTCDACKKGLNCYCENYDDYQLGISLHGTLTDYYVGDEKFFYKIPDSMDWKTAILVEPLCCALNTVTKAKIKSSDTILVFGCGTIGLLCQILSAKLGQKVVGIDINADRRAFASKFANYVYSPEELSIDEVYRINNGKKFDVVIDAVGNQVSKAFEYIEKGGVIVPMGLSSDYEVTIKPADFVNYGISMTGEVALHSAIGRSLEVAMGMPEISSLVTRVLPIEKYMEAFDELLSIETVANNVKPIKTVLISDESQI